jgi:release factor glutamine methyltransferase
MTQATVAELLRRAQQMHGLDRLDSQLLLGHVLHRDRTWLIVHDDHTPTLQDASAFESLCLRRAVGEPCAYLLGQREFHGLSLQVGPGVLVPRPDTETLVDWALEILESPLLPTAPHIADLGTGSGAIALSLLFRKPAAHVTAVDQSPAALAQASANAARLKLPIEIIASDWWRALDGRVFDLVVSNPPYIAGEDPHLEALRFEPREALTPGGDGLDAIRSIIAEAPTHLRQGAWLLLEHGWDQAAAVRALFSASGWHEVQSRKDLGGHERCTGACWKATDIS